MVPIRELRRDFNHLQNCTGNLSKARYGALLDKGTRLRRWRCQIPEAILSGPQDDCPECDMAMIVTEGFDREPDHQTFECLRCGHVEAP
jgi:hypothetical protein